MTKTSSEPAVVVPNATFEAAQSPRRRLGSDAVERFGLLGLLVVLIAIFSVKLPGTFATVDNWRTIATSLSVLAVLAVALIFPLVGGRFDISVGAMTGICSIATASAMSKYSFPLILAVAIGVGLGALIGLVNGVLVSYLGINSIIATLGMSSIIAGLVQAYTSGIPVSSGISSALTNLSVTSVLGVPVLFLIMLGVAGLAWFILTQSIYGRYLVAVGSNETAATLTGLSTRRIVMLSFVLAGFFAGAAGVLQVAAQGNGNPQVGGITFMLPALAAVFLGATTIRPGEYNVPGTLLALIFIGTAVSGLALMGVQTWVTDVFNGAAVVVAVGLSALFKRRRTGAAALGQ
jgi:ribose transport system permease protein